MGVPLCGLLHHAEWPGCGGAFQVRGGVGGCQIAGNRPHASVRNSFQVIQFIRFFWIMEVSAGEETDSFLFHGGSLLGEEVVGTGDLNVCGI